MEETDPRDARIAELEARVARLEANAEATRRAALQFFREFSRAEMSSGGPLAPENLAPPAQDGEFATVDEAAALLGLNRKTVYEAIRLGQLPGTIRIGRAIRIRREAILRWGLEPLPSMAGQPAHGRRLPPSR